MCGGGAETHFAIPRDTRGASDETTETTLRRGNWKYRVSCESALAIHNIWKKRYAWIRFILFPSPPPPLRPYVFRDRFAGPLRDCYSASGEQFGNAPLKIFLSACYMCFFLLRIYILYVYTRMCAYIDVRRLLSQVWRLNSIWSLTPPPLTAVTVAREKVYGNFHYTYFIEMIVLSVIGKCEQSLFVISHSHQFINSSI